jgi:hypothetical protein
MKRLIEFFDRTYVINLKDRADRRRGVEREFRSIGLEIPNGKVEFYTALRPTVQGDFYALGAKGSFTSHRNVLKLAAADDLKNVLVVEDDISFRNVSPEAIANVLEGLRSQDWDVVYFGYLEPESPGVTDPLSPWPHDTIGGHFYAVNRRFLGPMIKYMNECELRPRNHPLGGPMSRDGAFNHVRYVDSNIRVLIAVPNLAHQRSSRTDISPVKSFDRIGWLRPPIQFLRDVKTHVRKSLDRTGK